MDTAPDFDNVIEHYGIKGMKWGVRRTPEQLGRAQSKREAPKGEVVLTKKCKNGTTLTVTKNPPSRFQERMAKKYKSSAEQLSKSHSFTLTNKDNVKVGEASFYQETPTKLDLEWIGVKRAHRSNGYARAALEGVIDYAKANGITELELTASRMGKPLYEKLGFEDRGGHLYVLTIPKEIKHSEIDAQSLADFIVKRIDQARDLNEKEEVEMTNLDLDNVLEHYGIKGMKWGVRRTPEQLARARGEKPPSPRKARKAARKAQAEADRALPRSEDSQRANEARRIAKNAGTGKLSNKELQALVTRMNLESQYTKHLGQDQLSTGEKWLDKWIAMEKKAGKSNQSSPTANAAKVVKRQLDDLLGIDDTLERALKS